MKHFKLWGPLRSGTNYLGRVMELNFLDVEIHHNEGGWKHGPPQSTCYQEKDRARLHRVYEGNLLIMKNPLAWIDSMARYSMYLRLPSLEVLCTQWNQHAREIHSFQWRDDALFIQYERLIRHFEIQMKEIQTHFSLYKKAGQWLNEPRKMLRGGDEMKGEEAVSDTMQSKEYYLKKSYRSNLSPAVRGIIEKNIDSYLVQQLGYEDELYPSF